MNKMMTLEELDKQSREAVIAFLERKVDKLELRRITPDNYSLEWKDKVDGDVFNLECFYYRVKKQYRVSLFSDGKTLSVDNEHQEKYVSEHSMFVKWLTDWIRYE